MPWLFSDFSCFDMSLLLLTVTLRGVSSKHCLLSFFICFVVAICDLVHDVETIFHLSFVLTASENLF